MPVKGYGRVGMIARWKPVHLGHGAVLRALSAAADLVLIGIGSSNRYDHRNPFTLEETEEMIRLALGPRSNYRILPVPDLDDGPRWRVMVGELFRPLDLFVTDNPYVASLLREDFEIERPVRLVPEEERIPIDGTTVRRAMARGNGWRDMVPSVIADFIEGSGLDERFRREFGLKTLALEV